ncbi:phosphorylase [Leptolyngbya sp. FACHB-17]|uniref:ATP adenylyltransferase family protein n=1 Tax=Leptolyngbya sp. AS-A5 TaxID=2933919 RepID=UPI00168159F1|nr:phosphorylase [Leptolyngbya sp. FACHB-17]MBD2078945.1 phosphorylase [Leptolyngbya sp. FACHB-17]
MSEFVSEFVSDSVHLRLLENPGVLWQRTIEQTQHALSCGALLSIPTTHEFIEQAGAKFLVRTVTNLIRKEVSDLKQKQEEIATGKPINPFLPYDRDLFVVDISDTHVCLLNKFNVADHHLLIITRAFEEQEALLTLDDFAALWACLAEVDGLAFYNAGSVAGASQRHKHLQLVPFPFVEKIRLPIDPLINAVNSTDRITTIPEFPFIHAFTKLDRIDTAKQLLERYWELLEAVRIDSNQIIQSAPYNFLATREWMMIVPRSQAEYSAIAVNSLAFAGALLVRNSEQLETLKQLRPLNFLKNVAIASSSSAG